jgi:hypothetical protein
MAKRHHRQLDLRHAAGQGRRHGLQLEAEATLENTATAKIAQINNTILQRVIAIGIDPTSPTALNPVITRACNAGLSSWYSTRSPWRRVSTASAPRSPATARGWRRKGARAFTATATSLARGIAGTGSDTTSTSLAELKKYRGIKVVATINGDGSPDTARSALARSRRASARSTTAEDYLKLPMELAVPKTHQAGGPLGIPVAQSGRPPENHDMNIGAALEIGRGHALNPSGFPKRRLADSGG